MDRKITEIMARKCLGLKKREALLIVADDPLFSLASEVYESAKKLGMNAQLMTMTPRSVHGEEPPRTIAGAMAEADCALLLTSKSLSHTRARKAACGEHGTRIASLPAATRDMLQRAILIDYAALKEKARRLADLITRGKKLEVSTPAGTYVRMSIAGRKCFVDDGAYYGKGAFGNLPAGEVCIAPVEGTAEGRLVVDGSAPFVGKIGKPKEIIIRDGFAQTMPFKEIGSRIRHIGREGMNIAEFGIGLNPAAKIIGIVLEDEKALGTSHIAIGNNLSFGGSVGCPCHIDFVFRGPVVRVDGRALKI